MGKKFEGKVAIITGASKGIGAAIATHFASEGAAVVVNYSKSKTEADHIVEQIQSKGGKAIAVQANMSQPQEIKGLFSETIKQFGKVDIIVNNAGVYEFKALEEVTLDHFRHLFDLNVLGLLLVCQEAAKHLQAGGNIVNISSIASKKAEPNTVVYSATKAAVDSITSVLAKELGERKIRINSINPGIVETEGLHAAGIVESDFRKQTEKLIPLGRIGKPQDIAPAVLFFASDEASWISGETLVISGGLR